MRLWLLFEDGHQRAPGGPYKDRLHQPDLAVGLYDCFNRSHLDA